MIRLGWLARKSQESCLHWPSAGKLVHHHTKIFTWALEISPSLVLLPLPLSFSPNLSLYVCVVSPAAHADLELPK